MVVIGRGGRRIAEAHALEHVAGYTRRARTSPIAACSSPTSRRSSRWGSRSTASGRSGRRWSRSTRFADPNDLALTCDVGGERMQDARTSDMIFGVPALVAFLSRRCTLEPGDLIFTGTPAGVGSTRDPRRYLEAGRGDREHDRGHRHDAESLRRRRMTRGHRPRGFLLGRLGAPRLACAAQAGHGREDPPNHRRLGASLLLAGAASAQPLPDLRALIDEG